MNRFWSGFKLAIVLVFIAAAAAGTYAWRQQKIDTLNQQVKDLQSRQATNPPQPATVTDQYTSAKGVAVFVYEPAKDAKVASPLVVLGKVPGNWSFEAQFPVQLKDAGGNVIAHGTAQLQSDWMTSSLVPFTAKLEFSAPASGSGSLVLVKDNPSGRPETDDSVSIPVKY